MKKIIKLSYDLYSVRSVPHFNIDHDCVYVLRFKDRFKHSKFVDFLKALYESEMQILFQHRMLEKFA